MKKNLILFLIKIFSLCIIVFVYPLALIKVFSCSCYRRLRYGYASTILENPRTPFKPGCCSYAGQATFNKPFDEEPLQAALHSVSRELHIPDNMAVVKFHDKNNIYWPETPLINTDYYENNPLTPVKKRNIFREYDNEMLHLDIINNPAGQPTVMSFYLPSSTLDGTSNFNLVKEVISRYYGEKNNVIKYNNELKLSNEARKKIDSYSFSLYLLRLPLNLFYNLYSTCEKVLYNAFFHKKEKFESTYLNFNQQDSAAIMQAIQLKNGKPFSYFIQFAIEAYYKHYGKRPKRLNLQVSLQNRHFQPKHSDKNLIGDWLVGPSYKYNETDLPVKIEKCHAIYEKLLFDIHEIGPAIGYACYAKAYGLTNNGAASFQLTPFYPERNEFLSGVFFNNYGIRKMHNKAEIISWNWCAPADLGFNVIEINGHLCITFASYYRRLSDLQAIRQHVYDQIMALLKEKTV